MKVRKARLGVNLGTTMLVMAIVMTMLFGLVGVGIQHVQFLRAMANSDMALQLARSAVSQSIYCLIDQEDYGVNPTGATVKVLPSAGPAGAGGELTFDPSVGPGDGVPISTNNLAGNNSVNATDGVMVPAACARLVGVGFCGGVTRRVEAYLAMPPFPYAVATNGPLAGEALLVGGVTSAPNGTVPDLTQLQPADVLSNAAISFGPATNVTGDVVAVGNVVESSGVEIHGVIKQGQAIASLPAFNLTTYDPAVSGVMFNALGSSVFSAARTYSSVGVVRAPADVSFLGGLTLQDAVLFVNGNLTVNGGLAGSGLVVATGGVNLTGCSNLVGAQGAQSGLAVLAGGNLTVSGSGPLASYFQGILFTQGCCVASNVTVIGSLVCNGTQASNLTNSAMITCPISSGGNSTTNQTSSIQWAGFLSTPNTHGNATTVDVDIDPTPAGGWTVSFVDPVSGAVGPPTSVSNTSQLQAALVAYGITNAGGAPSLTNATGNTTLTQTVPFGVDLNQMLGIVDKMRVSWWHEY